MNCFTLCFTILVSIISLCNAVPYIHKSVKDELAKGPEAVIMVTFTPANVENANDPIKVYEAMKSIKRIPKEMSLETFVDEGFYSELRGVYVFHRVKAKQAATRKLLQKILPKGTIILSIPISNLFLLRNTEGTFDLIKDRDDIVEINTNQKFHVDLDKSEPSGLVPRMNPNRLKRLLDMDQDPEIQWNIKKIGASDVWRSGLEGGSRGEGIVYGIADTGVSFTHPTLNKNYRGTKKDGSYDHNFSWWDGVREKVPFAKKSTCPVSSSQPCDDQGHGTHCLSTATGSGGFGVAPGAKWIGCRNMDAGLGSTVTYLRCLNFFMAPHDLEGRHPRPELRPHVVGNSWGCPEYEGCSKHALTAAVEILRVAGVFMSVSAGNDGPECETIQTPPAIEPTVISVGAVDINDNLASFSSRGPVRIDGQVYRKPDLVAPGVSIMGAYLGGGYRRLSGTSMASPHIGGSVALMLSNCPCLKRNIDRIQAILESTAQKLLPSASLLRGGKLCGNDTMASYPNNYYGFGRVNVAKAVQTCQDFCSGKSNVVDLSSQDIPIKSSDSNFDSKK